MRRANAERMRRLMDRTRVLLPGTVSRLVAVRRQDYERRTGRFVTALIADALAARRELLDDRAERAGTAARHRLDRLRDRLAALDRVRETAGYEATLTRGYAVVWSGEHVVTDTEAAREAASLSLQFADGRVEVGAAAVRRKARTQGEEPEQGSLF
jgi:exodeoxyribonuclease VII large subunit